MERIKFKWNIPNVLSLVRLALIPLFAWLYLDDEGNLYWAMLVLLFSGLTDVVDGFVARRFNQITEIGKLLDPLADKLTQLAVLICLSVRYTELVPLMVICLVKEVLQIVGGVLLLSRYEVVRGSRWFGKISTFTFYGAMLAIVLWNDMPRPVLLALIALVAVTMLFSFFAYMRVYLKLRREAIEGET